MTAGAGLDLQESEGTVHNHNGYSEEQCVRCGWVMGSPALNCNNDDTPHVFPSQLPRYWEGQREFVRTPIDTTEAVANG
jgi:hypothetical protein